MKINILAFGPIAELAGKSKWEMTGIRSTGELRNRLLADIPALITCTYALAVNTTVVFEDMILKEDDTVALLPPFSGG
jgi:molybdopterin synthase sulfur carrier subunit